MIDPNNIRKTSTATSLTVPNEVELLAHKLVKIHGDAYITKERSGWHIYFPSPEKLKRDGLRELYSGNFHGAYNVSKYLDSGRNDRKAFGTCMKYKTPYSLKNLLNMPNINDRGYDFKMKETFRKNKHNKHFEKDDKGNLVPKQPGVCVSLSDLPTDHVAIKYLTDRNFDPELLVEQFNTKFCTKEGEQYEKWPTTVGNFKKTPQNRLIFFFYTWGLLKGWQARILEKQDDAFKYIYHPITNKWFPVAIKKGNKYEPLPGFEAFNPAKYFIGAGFQKSTTLIGFDAALKKAKQTNNNKVVLVEGVLDSNRVHKFMPCIPVLGKSINFDQIKNLVNYFSDVYIMKDNDDGGKDFQKSVTDIFNMFGKQPNFIDVPSPYKDLGDMSYEEVGNLLQDKNLIQ